jgi:hypothetical protein
MTRASYREGVRWIATNDEPLASVAATSELTTVLLLADLFGRSPDTVGRDVMHERARQAASAGRPDWSAIYRIVAQTLRDAGHPQTTGRMIAAVHKAMRTNGHMPPYGIISLLAMTALIKIEGWLAQRLDKPKVDERPGVPS